MLMIMILAKFELHVRRVHMGNTIGMRGFYLIKINCLTMCSLCELLVRETHGSSIIGHFADNKTLDILHELFY